MNQSHTQPNARSNAAHRQAVQGWAQGLMAGGFYVLDTETTGLGKGDEIVQIAIVDQQGAAVMNELVKPRIPIPRGASAIHGITDRHVRHAPGIGELYTEISRRLAGEIIVAYNMDFDWRMLQQSFGKLSLPAIRVLRRDCAMKQYARYHGRRSHRGGYAWHKLQNAARQEGLGSYDAHDALSDARMTWALVRKMAAAD